MAQTIELEYPRCGSDWILVINNQDTFSAFFDTIRNCSGGSCLTYKNGVEIFLTMSNGSLVWNLEDKMCIYLKDPEVASGIGVFSPIVGSDLPFLPFTVTEDKLKIYLTFS